MFRLPFQCLVFNSASMHSGERIGCMRVGGIALLITGELRW